MARVVEEPSAAARPAGISTPGRRGGPRGRRARHGHRARTAACWPTPSASGAALAGGREPRRPARGGGRARRARLARRARAARTVGTRLLYAAVPIDRAGEVVGVARLSRGIERIEAQGKALWRSAALAGLLALAASGLVSLLLSAAPRPLARRDHGDRPSARERQPRGSHPGQPRGRARRARAHHQPLGRRAAAAPGRDRPRPGPHRRDPLRDGRRRARRSTTAARSRSPTRA